MWSILTPCGKGDSLQCGGYKFYASYLAFFQNPLSTTPKLITTFKRFKPGLLVFADMEVGGAVFLNDVQLK